MTSFSVEISFSVVCVGRSNMKKVLAKSCVRERTSVNCFVMISSVAMMAPRSSSKDVEPRASVTKEGSRAVGGLGATNGFGPAELLSVENPFTIFQCFSTSGALRFHLRLISADDIPGGLYAFSASAD